MRDGLRDGLREGVREGLREGGREGLREGGREGSRNNGREDGREWGREGIHMVSLTHFPSAGELRFTISSKSSWLFSRPRRSQGQEYEAVTTLLWVC